jgi:lysophospholipase L1-like esterase
MNVCGPRLIAFTLVALAAMTPPPAGAADAPLLGRTFEKLRAQKALTVGYFGGSITAGAGASKGDETSWRALTTKWFRDQFPGARITEINAAIGGTGSELGAFRCRNDLLSKNPDLVFVEYAVNDGGGQDPLNKRTMEGIVRQIWTANPRADVVFIYTSTKALAPAYDKGETPNAIRLHGAVARHYGIAEVNVGKALWQAIKDGKGTWETLAPDSVHPSDAGYRIYADVVAAFLEAHKADAPAPPPVTLPAPLTKDPLDKGRLVDATAAEAPGWKVEEKSLAGRTPRRLVSDAPGSTLTFKFTGTAVGVYWLVAPDSGDVEWSIDGSPPKRRSSWDRYALKFTRPHYTVFSTELPPGEHVLTIKVLAEKNEQSTGTAVRIGAFLVN